MAALEPTSIAGLYTTPAADLPYIAGVKVRTFFIERPVGNILIYNSPGIAAAADDIAARGGATQLLINHEHESMYGVPGIDVPVFVHHADATALRHRISAAEPFEKRHRIGEDLEATPLPGHTPGTTVYLWNNGHDRVLFTGDSVWDYNGQWQAVVLNSRDRDRYLESLRTIREIDFTAIAPWAAFDGRPTVLKVTREDARDRMDAIIERVSAGENH